METNELRIGTKLIYESLQSLVVMYDDSANNFTEEIDAVCTLLASHFNNVERVYALIVLWLTGNHTKEYEYISPYEIEAEDKPMAFTKYLVKNHG